MHAISSSRTLAAFAVAAIVSYAMTAVARNATDICRPAPVIPLASASEPPAKIVSDAPLAEPLASRGVAIIQTLVKLVNA